MARTGQVQRPLSDGSPYGLRGRRGLCVPFGRMCGSRRCWVVAGEPAVLASATEVRPRSWHTSTTSTTFCRSDHPKRLAGALTPLAHRVSPEELPAGRVRGDYEAFRSARFLAVSLTDPRTGSRPGVRGCAVIAHRSPAGHRPGDASAQAPGGQPVPQNPRAVAGRECSAPVLPRWARYPADHRSHLLIHLEAANAGLTS
jgi:hypothetical protein